MLIVVCEISHIWQLSLKNQEFNGFIGNEQSGCFWMQTGNRDCRFVKAFEIPYTNYAPRT